MHSLDQLLIALCYNMYYVKDTKTTGSTGFKNLKALGYSDLSIARVILRPKEFCMKPASRSRWSWCLTNLRL